MTEGERRLWSELRRFKPNYGIHVRRQVPIGPLVVDFAVLQSHLVIELDGEFHFTESGIKKDALRDAQLAEIGYRVLRINTGELADNIDGCIETILHELGIGRSCGPDGTPMTSTSTMSDRALRWLEASGAAMPGVAIIQPADPFLDMAGESMRGRIFLTSDETGEALCLRPEFTIPVCLAHIAAGSATPRRYGYCGVVFRQRREGGSEFVQAGIEDIGDADRASADARSLAEAADFVRTLSPGTDWQATVGDQAVFEAVVSALGLPRGWQKKLARAFGQPKQLEAHLEALSAPRNRDSNLPEDIAAPLEAADSAALEAAIAARMEEHAMSAGAGRAPGEIAARLLEQAGLDNARLSADGRRILSDFLSIRAALGDAPALLRRFAGRLDGGLGAALDVFDARMAAVGSTGLDMATITYDAAFGRALDYYTGLVYELAAPGADRPAAGGGRYDRLLTLLGASEPTPGVGFSVWLDRLGGAA